MTKSIFARVSRSPISLSFLLATTISLVIVWQRSEAVMNAPQIKGYDWTQHPNALLVVYPEDDCGCGLTVSNWVKSGIVKQLDVVVVSKANQPEWDVLKKEYPNKVTIVTNAPSDIMQEFTPRKSVGAAWIQNGKIVRRTDGIPTTDFYQGGEK